MTCSPSSIKWSDVCTSRVHERLVRQSVASTCTLGRPRVTSDAPAVVALKTQSGERVTKPTADAVQIVKAKSTQGNQDKVSIIIEKLVTDYAKSTSANHRKVGVPPVCGTHRLQASATYPAVHFGQLLLGPAMRPAPRCILHEVGTGVPTAHACLHQQGCATRHRTL